MDKVRYHTFRCLKRSVLRFDPLNSQSGAARELMRLMAAPLFFQDKSGRPDKRGKYPTIKPADMRCKISIELLDTPFIPKEPAKAELEVEYAHDGSVQVYSLHDHKLGDIFDELETLAKTQESGEIELTENVDETCRKLWSTLQ